jgi:hypothetical protein
MGAENGVSPTLLVFFYTAEGVDSRVPNDTTTHPRLKISRAY